ncbi:GNAT family N-acetyltransferase [Costertonia aggregata]|uniref:GNAT family N-acetyltransferase n=1 Tax=Costertonia aggregata TaxID=343403 RepID=A0A7H9ATA7_9FLAO|nr:GNAT family N-acetyltransferase [Costertonia aggregata]QLG46680.1 GNAT family N-acetyltransferase [Costertonia aggregata]
MGFLKNIELNFTEDFFEKLDTPYFYNSVINKTTSKQKYLNVCNDVIKENKDNIYLVHFIPPFLELSLNTQPAVYSRFSFNHFVGLLCNLTDCTNADDYMVKQFGSKGRRNILARLRRLETCFDIKYKMFDGNIGKDECKGLMEKFRLMIVNRFAQRGIKHGNIDYWDFYQDSAYDMIINKKASLFVVYNSNVPIAISIGYMYENIFESAISSYEIDYAKFGLGNIVVLKKIEWCFENGFTIFNMRWGDYKYKRDWCNTVYNYKSEVIYNGKSLVKKIKAFFITKKSMASTYMIINKERFNLLAKIRWYLLYGNRPKVKPTNATLPYRVEDCSSNIQDKITKINIYSQENSFVRKPVFDFQYVNSEKSSNIEVFRVGDKRDERVYLVKGLKKQKLLFFDSVD